MFEQALGLDKSFDFDASAQKPVQNFDVFAATRNISNIAQNNDVRTAQEAAALADNEIALFDRNAAQKTQFIQGNNNFSLNRLSGFQAELDQVLKADRALLTSGRDSAINIAANREAKDEAKLLRETNRLEDLQDAALGLGINEDLDDLEKLSLNIAKETKRRNDIAEEGDGFEYDPITGTVSFVGVGNNKNTGSGTGNSSLNVGTYFTGEGDSNDEGLGGESQPIIPTLSESEFIKDFGSGEEGDYLMRSGPNDRVDIADSSGVGYKFSDEYKRIKGFN